MSAVPADEADLRLAIAFVNTYDLLESPPDMLTLAVAARICRAHGRVAVGDHFDAIPPSDADHALERLRDLRDGFYRIFAAADAPETAVALNAVMNEQTLRPHVIVASDDRLRLTLTVPLASDPLASDPLASDSVASDPVAALGVIVAAALAHALIVGGAGRLGTCAGDPCRCVFVDRTRAGRQRFCCQLCNDRVAAAAYRSRRAGTS